MAPTQAPPVPRGIRRITEAGIGIGIEITWADDSPVQISSRILRTSCPCAVCNEKRGDTSHAKPLTGGRALLQVVTATQDEETNLEKIWPVGSYALGMRWADAHDSGIYTFSYLKELSERAKE